MKKVVLCFLLLLALAGCSSMDKAQLKVYNWGDYIDPEVIDMFEEQTGISVVYDVFDTNEDMYTTIKTSGGPTYDVIIPSDYMIRRMINEGMLAELDKSNLPNLEKIDPQFRNLAFDADEQYSVPYMWGTLGIAYNTERVIEPVESWGILWDPKYQGDIFMMDSVRDSMAVALKFLGHSLNTKEPAEIEAAYNKLLEQKPLVLAYTGDEVKDKMIAGEAALAVVYSGDYVTIADGNDAIAYAIPEEGSNLWFDSMCILKNAEHKKEAEMFINFMCSEEIAERTRAYINFSSPQAEVIAALPEEIRQNPAQYPPEEALENCEVFEDLAASTAYYEELWTKLLSS